MVLKYRTSAERIRFVDSILCGMKCFQEAILVALHLVVSILNEKRDRNFRINSHIE
jgi:hypothetical protein